MESTTLALLIHLVKAKPVPINAAQNKATDFFLADDDSIIVTAKLRRPFGLIVSLLQHATKHCQKFSKQILFLEGPTRV